MKYFLIILLIVLIVYIGRGLSKYFTEKSKYYRNLYEILKKIQLNISFEKHKLYDIIRKIPVTNNAICATVDEYLNYLKNGQAINLKKNYLLCDEERIFIIEILCSIGTSDTDTELKKLDNYLTVIDIDVQSTKCCADKYAPLCTKMSLLIGLLLAVLLV